MDSENTKEVFYSEYCSKCQFYKTDEGEDPCNDCLSYPYQWYSHKPLRFKPKE